MSSAETARHRRDCIRKGIPTGRSREETFRVLPWPRDSEDGTPLGVDLSARSGEVRALMMKSFRRPPPGMEFDDYLQEVLMTIARRNCMPSAHDPRRSSFSHYVHLVARGVGANIASAPRSWTYVPYDVPDRSASHGGFRPEPWLSSFEAPPTDWAASDALVDLSRLGASGAVGPEAATWAASVLRGSPACDKPSYDARRRMVRDLSRAAGP